MRPTVLIVDDHAAFRASARALLQAEGFDVVGEAADGAAAVAAVAVLRPEIVLLDLQLPDLDGLRVAEQLAGAPDPPAVVLISSRDAAAYEVVSQQIEPGVIAGLLSSRSLPATDVHRLACGELVPDRPAWSGPVMLGRC